MKEGAIMVFEPNFIWVALMQLVSHIVQGCTGFGATVIASPVTVGLLGHKVGVPYGTLVTMPMLYYLAVKEWKQIEWKILLYIIGLMAPGVLLGNYLFASISATVAKVCIGGFVFCVALYGVYKMFILVPKQRKAAVDGVVEEAPDTIGKKIFRYGCLLVGGCVHGAFNIGGPLVTVFSIFAIKDKTRFRATMTMVWVIVNTCFNAVSHYSQGLWTPYMWSALAVGFPLAASGFYFGHLIHTRINQETFLKGVYCTLTIVGGSMLFQNLPKLFA
jgi:uncharacterized membrane protein YfcA